MMTWKSITLFVTLQIFSLFNEGQACHTYLSVLKRRKRTIDEEVQDTEILRQYFTDCLEDKVGSIPGWQSTVDYSILLTNWYRNTEDFTCLGDSTADCWKDELSVYVQSDSSSAQVLQAGKDCIDQYEADQALFINEYEPRSNRRKRQTEGFPSRGFPPGGYPNPEVGPPRPRSPIPGYPDPAKQRYDNCVAISSSQSAIGFQRLNIATLSNFVNDHLQYSCDSRKTRSSTPELSAVWPYRFVALTRLDTPLRDSLLDCGKLVYPPAPFWGKFGKWSECSKTCGAGTQTRKRKCKDGANPRLPSTGCVGDDTQTRRCNLRPCQQRCGWRRWSNWTPCRPLFGCYGQQIRSRVCLCGRQQVASRLCDGDDTETRTCFTGCPA
ncbi:uncharacterized protein LOC143446410 [Clavelina lepadiformis]|uniref:uncharacterized protein LOC143446410 n=1 Tax=Clavelina lepadiformis TaxID=159417 RepID=UPI0040410CAD